MCVWLSVSSLPVVTPLWQELLRFQKYGFPLSVDSSSVSEDALSSSAPPHGRHNPRVNGPPRKRPRGGGPDGASEDAAGESSSLHESEGESWFMHTHRCLHKWVGAAAEGTDWWGWGSGCPWTQWLPAPRSAPLCAPQNPPAGEWIALPLPPRVRNPPDMSPAHRVQVLPSIALV